MAKEVPFKDLHIELKTFSNEVVRKVVIEVDSRLKLASPVKTGRFRASWQVGKNGAPGSGAPPGNYGRAYGIQRIGYGQEEIGASYHVHNSLPYAQRLAMGWSKQAPSGWINNIATQVGSWANANIKGP